MGLIRRLAFIVAAAVGIAALAHSGFVVAQQIPFGRAGAPNGNVVTVQGIANATPVNVAISGALGSGGATPYHLAGGSAASTNSTLVASGAHSLKSLSLVNTQSTTNAYFRLYDSGSAPTCSSATNAQPAIPVIAGPGGIAVPLPTEGWKFVNGIAFCITGGGADTDNTNAPTGVFVIASFQ